MGFPKLKRVNTVGIRYTKGERDEAHYWEIINNKLGVPKDQIYGMAEMGPKRFMVKFHSFFTYNKVVKEFDGKSFTIDNDHDVEIEDLSTYKNRVRVQKVPFEMDENSLKNLLGRYGKVENVTTSLKKFGDYDGMLSDERIEWMIVKFPIPSSLFIKDSETYMYFSYLEQPKTCHKCGSEFHMVSQCTIFRTTKPKDRENATDLDQVDMHVTDPNIANNNNRSRHSSESSNSNSNSDFEDSKSALSAESDSDHVILMADPSQSVQGNNSNENMSETLASGPEANTTFTTGGHINAHVVEIGETEVSHTQMPIPKARNSFISSSQPVVAASSSIYNQIKRALSLSPQNTSEHHSTPKSARLTGNAEFV